MSPSFGRWGDENAGDELVFGRLQVPKRIGWFWDLLDSFFFSCDSQYFKTIHLNPRDMEVTEVFFTPKAPRFDFDATRFRPMTTARICPQRLKCWSVTKRARRPPFRSGLFGTDVSSNMNGGLVKLKVFIAIFLEHIVLFQVVFQLSNDLSAWKWPFEQCLDSKQKLKRLGFKQGSLVC